MLEYCKVRQQSHHPSASLFIKENRNSNHTENPSSRTALFKDTIHSEGSTLTFHFSHVISPISHYMHFMTGGMRPQRALLHRAQFTAYSMSSLSCNAMVKSCPADWAVQGENTSIPLTSSYFTTYVNKIRTPLHEKFHNKMVGAFFPPPRFFFNLQHLPPFVPFPLKVKLPFFPFHCANIWTQTYEPEMHSPAAGKQPAMGLSTPSPPICLSLLGTGASQSTTEAGAGVF